jgi:transcriptional regulator with XRE-family HTH domain
VTDLLRHFVFQDQVLGASRNRWMYFFLINEGRLEAFAHSGMTAPPAETQEESEIAARDAFATRRPGLDLPLLQFGDTHTGAQPVLVDGRLLGYLVFIPSPGEMFRNPTEARLLAALTAFCFMRPRSSSGVSIAVGKELRGVRESAGLTQEDVAGYIGLGRIGRITFSGWESGTRPPTWNKLLAWCLALGVLAPEGALTIQPAPIIQLLPNITPEMLQFLKEDPQRLHGITPEQFENLACDRLDRMGFAVTKTGATNRKDGGLDIIAAKRLPAFGDLLLAAQVKHHRGDQKVGVGAVRDFLSFNNSMFRFGLILTNTAFTTDAKWRAAQTDAKFYLRLRDFEAMKLWLMENFAGESDYTELPKEVELAPGVVIQVPRPKIF